MTVSLGTVTACCHCRSSPWHCAAVGCCAHSWLQHPCRTGHPVPTAPRSISRATLLPTLGLFLQHSKPSVPQELGTAPPHLPQENVHDEQLSAGSQDRRKSKGRVTSKKRPFEGGGSLLPPFQAGSFHYLSPHPAPRDLWLRDTHSHLLLREPKGQGAGHHPGGQTDRQTQRKGQERERKSQLAGRKHQARRLAQWA